ncbi:MULTISPECIES: ATP-binding protein [unclassified Streptomyces]|uniref:ATP-binding protein n=1 Tax=unclassified Streptomyces TaxID=2593676 RepID=UPI001B36691A|nr:ATP-binding protein [Streptomyces sp. RM72]MBQ0888678.1 sensor histidine kinase [Streptomyces sp. RM72]
MLDPQVTTAILGAGFAVTSAGLVAQTRAKRALAARCTRLEKQHKIDGTHLAALETEIRHFAEVAMPAMVDVLARGHRGVPVPGLSQEELAGTVVDHAHQAVRRLLQEAVAVTREQIGRTARSAVRDMIDEAQTGLQRCQMRVIEEMERHPDGTSYHQSLMGIDHLVTQSLHTLQRMRILTGSWPGLQRADCTVREIVESARGRISDYLRVSYTYEPRTGETWLEGRVVEPVTVALTELLSNAAAFSDGKVFVEVQAFQTGYCIVVDDGGLNMNPFQRESAARQLGQREVLDVTTVQDTGQLGFAVIGRLASDYGFSADVTSTSPYGGVRAVLRIPLELFGRGPTAEEIEADRQAAAARAGQHMPLHAGPAASTGAADTTPAQPTTSGGLPQRRRRSPIAAAPASGSAPAPADDPDAFSASLAQLGRTIHDTENTPEGDHLHD